MMSNYFLALGFAIQAHADQKRKYTGEDYSNHPLEVVKILICHSELCFDHLAAALLHDVVEDCGVTYRQLYDKFGFTTTCLVYWLSDKSRPSDGNRAIRKEIDKSHIAKAPPEAKTIKLADLISNTISIVEHDPKFAKIYVKEKEELLKVLKEGDPTLWKMADSLVKESKIKLGMV